MRRLRCLIRGCCRLRARSKGQGEKARGKEQGARRINLNCVAASLREIYFNCIVALLCEIYFNCASAALRDKCFNASLREI